MSGESASDAQSGNDATDESAALTGSADAIVPAFDVPPAESFEVPDAATAAADFDVPPPPSFETPAVPPAPSEAHRAAPSESDATWSSERTWKSRSTWQSGEDSKPSQSRAAARSETVAAVHPAAAVVPPPVPEDTGYRGWTITIFTGLAVLFIAAIVLIIFLVNSGPMSLSTAAEATSSAVTWAANFVTTG